MPITVRGALPHTAGFNFHNFIERNYYYYYYYSDYLHAKTEVQMGKATCSACVMCGSSVALSNFRDLMNKPTAISMVLWTWIISPSSNLMTQTATRPIHLPNNIRFKSFPLIEVLPSKWYILDFPGGPLDENLPDNAGNRVWPPVQEDSTCCWAMKPMHHNYWSPHALEPMLCNKRRCHSEKPVHCS